MIIGLIGNKRTGKTTCSNFLVNDYDFKSIAFADPIKEAMKIAKFNKQLAIYDNVSQKVIPVAD